tara:strand:+ start:43911 stop:44645 length:735 start_codon:yes stop_codon:yes gene_type:complete
MWTPEQISSFVDLTSLNSFDSVKSIESFLAQTRSYQDKGFKVAAVCFYPNFAQQAVSALKGTGIKTAVVAGSFPSSQSFLATRLNECELALEAGVDEIDIVLNLGAFADGNTEQVVEEVRAFKGLMPNKTLKVILETGYLETADNIALASKLAIEGGADFIKTSTGKDFPGASLEAAQVMSQQIKKHHDSTGKLVGLKISGGVRTKEQAEEYIKVVQEILGESFIHPDTFRIGASSLMKNLVNS